MQNSDGYQTIFPKEDRSSFLLLASTGGHLAQLVRLAKANDCFENSTWVTFRSPQSQSLLSGQKVIYVDYIAPRDLCAVLRARRALDTLQPQDFSRVISTGAALAIAGFLWARTHHLPAFYIESVSRTDGPSLTGKIVGACRLARTFTQHPSWAGRKWTPMPSVMSSYQPILGPPVDPVRPLKIFVTLGTIQPYRFDALVDRINRIISSEEEVVWQLGATFRDDLEGDIHFAMTAEDFEAAVRSADVVVTHSGVGSILQLLDQGVSPVVVPRESARGEHVDDHQFQIWRLLRDSNVGVPVQVSELTREHLVEAASMRTGKLSGRQR